MNKPKYIVEEIKPEIKRTDICDSCGSLLVVKQYGLYEEAICMAGCGATYVTKQTRPNEYELL